MAELGLGLGLGLGGLTSVMLKGKAGSHGVEKTDRQTDRQLPTYVDNNVTN